MASWRPILSITPATGVIHRYTPTSVRTIPNYKFERDTISAAMPAPWLTQMGTDAVREILEHFRLTGCIPS